MKQPITDQSAPEYQKKMQATVLPAMISLRIYRAMVMP